MNKALFAFIISLLLYPCAVSEELPGPIPAEVVRVVDGDTIRVRAMIWVNQSVEVSVRLRGVDAPELFRPKCAAEKSLAQAAKDSVVATTPAGSHVQLLNVKPDKYGGRVVATVATAHGGTLAAHLLAGGQAIEMGADKPWCGV